MEVTVLRWQHSPPDVQVLATAEGHIRVLGLAATRVYVDVNNPSYHQKPCRYLWPVLPLGHVLVHVATRGHSGICNPTAVKMMSMT